MNSDQLQYLLDIAKTGSINTTAKRMYSSQPAISESIKKLENELHCTLLKRSKKGVELTMDGKYILSHVIPMLEHYNQMLHYKDDDKSPHGVLSIGVAAGITNTILSDLIFKMQDYYPNVSLYSYEASFPEILDTCSKEIIDFGLLGASPPFEEMVLNYSSVLTLKPLFTTPLVCVMHKNNPNSTKKEIRFYNESQLKFTVYNYSSFPYISNDSCPHMSSNTSIHKRFISEKNTACVLPKYFADKLFTEPKYVTLPIVDVEPSVYYLAYHKNKNIEKNEVCKTFIRVLEDLT